MMSSDTVYKMRFGSSILSTESSVSTKILTHIRMAPPTAVVSNPPSLTHPIDHKGVKHLLDTCPNLRTLPPAYVLPEPVAPPSATFAIPVIDLGGLDDPTTRSAVIRTISSACNDGGLFLVVNHGIKTSLMADMLRAAEAFFALPLEEKMKYASDDDMAPVRYGSSLNTTEPQPHHFWRDYLRHFGRPVIAESCHLWPSDPADYKNTAKEFLEETWDLAMRLAGAISEGLGKDKGFVEGTFGEGLQTISCNYYPPCPEPELALGVGAHTDQGAISILVANDFSGLQMKHEGKWIAVPHVPGSLVVNLGDYLEKVSEGRFKAADHRVVLNETTARISVAVGNGPEPKHLAPCSTTVLRFV